VGVERGMVGFHGLVLFFGKEGVADRLEAEAAVSALEYNAFAHRMIHAFAVCQSQ